MDIASIRRQLSLQRNESPNQFDAKTKINNNNICLRLCSINTMLSKFNAFYSPLGKFFPSRLCRVNRICRI